MRSSSRLECIDPERTPEQLAELQEELSRCLPRFRKLAEVHALLASESRLKILSLLGCAGELCVCDLATVLGMTPAAVSQHLSRLKAGGLVRARRDGMTVFSSLVSRTWLPAAPPPELHGAADAPVPESGQKP